MCGPCHCWEPPWPIEKEKDWKPQWLWHQLTPQYLGLPSPRQSHGDTFSSLHDTWLLWKPPQESGSTFMLIPPSQGGSPYLLRVSLRVLNVDQHLAQTGIHCLHGEVCRLQHRVAMGLDA